MKISYFTLDLLAQLGDDKAKRARDEWDRLFFDLTLAPKDVLVMAFTDRENDSIQVFSVN